jgi:hypothetical protein
MRGLLGAAVVGLAALNSHGQPPAEKRVVYAEGLSDEEQAVNLLGTRRIDGKLSVAVFNDPDRMYRDILADVARSAIDDILGSP